MTDDDDDKPYGYVADLPDAIDKIVWMFERIKYKGSDKIDDAEFDGLKEFAERLRATPPR